MADNVHFPDRGVRVQHPEDVRHRSLVHGESCNEHCRTGAHLPRPDRRDR